MVDLNNGLRYYLCLRSEPKRALMQGHERYTLPSVPADGLEAEAWRVVCGVLLDERRLREALEDARNANRADERKRERLCHLHAEIARLEKLLDKQTMELLLAEGGSASEVALRRAGKEIDGQLGDLGRSAAELEAQPVAGLSSDDVEAIEQFAAEVREGMDAVTPADQHRIFKLLRLRGTVVQDEANGVQLRRRRFSIDRQADLPLPHGTTMFSILPGT